MAIKQFVKFLSLLFIFSYVLCWDYKKGGEDWNMNYCNNNTEQQSPIALATSDTRTFTPPFYLFPRFKNPLTLTYNDLEWTFRLENNFGFIYTIEPFSIVHGLTFECKFLEFHAPAEHIIDGKHYSVEMQIHTTFSNGNALPKCTDATFSFFFNTTQGKDNAFLAQFLTKLDKNGTKVDVNFDELIPLDAVNKYTIYSYRGSHTVPNCDPNVNWYLMVPPMDISAAQLKLFNDRWRNNPKFADGHGNNRHTKAQNTTVFRYP